MDLGIWKSEVTKKQHQDLLRGIRHIKSCDQVTIGRGNIFILWKYKGWHTVEFVETFGFNSMNDHCLA